MSVADRRRRERASRHDLIIAAARDLAEAEGWEAVTTRRLADLVEYSQPVLYSHFDGKGAIVRAVAIEGFEDLAAQLRQAQSAVDEPGLALRAVCSAYLTFAAERPALYQAMFVLPIDVKFASEDTPSPLKAAFGELISALRPFDAHPALRAEITWAALHGLAVLRRGDRIPPEGHEARIDLLVSQIINECAG
ncbi:TetR/AcrR family transcriptional regulator [Rhodopila sp.]|uniref:TetR/AcrR family transcriptional regulator n=1 Tax=Rhodopila sp. TaxID=2480087 RepID=UPI003D0F13B6